MTQLVASRAVVGGQATLCVSNRPGPRRAILPRPQCGPVVTLDGVESVPSSLLVERLGALSSARMREVCAALAIAVDCR